MSLDDAAWMNALLFNWPAHVCTFNDVCVVAHVTHIRF